jgi:hypothetical protein
MANSKYSYHYIINKIRPEALFSIINNNYSTLQWFDKIQIAPTQDEIEAYISDLEKNEVNTEHHSLRMAEYPAIGDQLDALWKGGQDAENMRAKINAVKAKYPKK